MEKEYFQLFPQHKKMIISHLKSLYKIEISEDEVEEIQKEEPFVNFNYRQAEFLRRIIVLRKFCDPNFENLKQVEKIHQERFQFSWANHHFNEAKWSFIHGRYLASTILCRSSLEIGLKEGIAHIISSKKKTIKDLILKAQELRLVQKGEINTIFILHPKLKFSFRPRKLLDKFIHGSYSDLFVLVQGITVGDKGKGKNFVDFINKMTEMDAPMRKDMKFGESFTRSTYARMLLREEIALSLICALANILNLIFFERLPKLL